MLNGMNTTLTAAFAKNLAYKASLPKYANISFKKLVTETLNSNDFNRIIKGASALFDLSIDPQITRRAKPVVRKVKPASKKKHGKKPIVAAIKTKRMGRPKGSKNRVKPEVVTPDLNDIPIGDIAPSV